MLSTIAKLAEGVRASMIGPMSSEGRSSAPKQLEVPADVRIGVVVSGYYAQITSRLREGAVRELARLVPGAEVSEIVDVPGCFELTVAASVLAHSGRFDGVVSLGCLVKGETSHDRYIAQAVANGLTQVAVETRVPIGFGVLTVDSIEQAHARSGAAGSAGKGNKGAEAMGAVLQTIVSLRSVGQLQRSHP